MTLSNPTQSTPPDRCMICGSSDLAEMVTIPQVPVLVNVLWDSREAARSAPRADIGLVHCNNCGHVFNAQFAPARMEYDQAYENSLHFSPFFQGYASWLADDLIARYSLRGKKVIEIGSGKGDFLRLLCERGGNQGLGFDPSARPEDSADGSIRFVQGYYTAEQAGIPADLVYSRHTLEHMPRPQEFLALLRHNLASSPETVVFLEVPNVMLVLKQLSIWDLIYEHVSYFSACSLGELFRRAGFQVLNLRETYEEQFLSGEASLNGGPSGGPVSIPEHERIGEYAGAFRNRFAEKIAGWQDRLADLRSRGRRAVVWGAGSKGISFLNMLEVGDTIPYVVDINPRKLGKFATGSGQEIIHPDGLQEYRPDVIIVMNPIYQPEIERTVRAMGLEPEYWQAI